MEYKRWQSINKTEIPLLIWGASDQCRINFFILKQLGYKVVALIDDTINKVSPIEDIPIIYNKEGLNFFLKKQNTNNYGFVLAIGNPYGHIRRKLNCYLKNLGLIPISFADPTALICESASFGEGVQIIPASVIHNNVIIGNQCIINTRSLIEHDCVLNDGVEVGPGAVLCGRVIVGENAWVGANATINPRIKIGKNSIVGSGAVVVEDTPDNVILAGVPARVIGENNKYE